MESYRSTSDAQGRRSIAPLGCGLARLRPGWTGSIQYWIVCGILLTCLWLPAAAESQVDLTELSLEDLMNIEVTSVSKKAERIGDAAAAIYVVTKVNIRRSGATSIAEVLRMVPGLQIASIDANKWAVSARGFNGRFANKMLVLIDGRSVYTSLFSGVSWETLGPALEDIERIEVIRGPGASLWGANAVNGVINIITKTADETQKNYVAGGFGSEERGFGNIRYAGEVGDRTSYRASFSYLNRDAFTTPSGSPAADDWDCVAGSFRLDHSLSIRDALTVMGGASNVRAGQNYTTVTSLDYPYYETFYSETKQKTLSLLGRWERSLSPSSDVVVQTYLSRLAIEDVLWNYSEYIADFDFQHRFGFGNRHEFLWGLGYRSVVDQFAGSFSLSYDPERRTSHQLNIFAQGNVVVVPEHLRMTLGSKIEHNGYTGFEIQPNARIAWTPNPNHTVWTAVSRAVRTPSRSESDMHFVVAAYPPGALSPGAPTAVLALQGNEEYCSEELVAYEIGYRTHPLPRLSADLALFYNDYDDLRGSVVGEPYLETAPEPIHLTVPMVIDNTNMGKAYGAEVALSYDLLDSWRVYGSYTYLKVQLRPKDGYASESFVVYSGESPQNRAYLRSSIDVTERLELDVTQRYTDRLAAFDIDSHVEFDVRLAYRFGRNATVSLVGLNLLEKNHQEFVPDVLFSEPAKVERSVYGKIRFNL